MSKIDPFQLNRQTFPSQTKVFSDPTNPGVELELTCRKLDGAETSLAYEEGDRLFTVYMGDPGSGTPAMRPFPPVQGRPVALSRILCTNASFLFAMQCPESEQDKYTFEQLVALSVTMPGAWLETVSWSASLGSTSSAKNDSAAATEA